MREFHTCVMDAILKLKDSIAAAKARNDNGIYKTVFLDSQEEADTIVEIFSDEGFSVTLHDAHIPDHYGFFITWDD